MAPATRRYRLGHDYRDTGSVNAPADEFLGWINVPEAGCEIWAESGH